MERDLSVIFWNHTWNDFNSHAHVERDHFAFQPIGITIISTHTLTWSVTWITLSPSTTLIDFNSHAHVERDWQRLFIRAGYGNFNSHAHVERD